MGLTGVGGTHEVDTDGRDVGLGICVVGESQEQAGLSNTGVTDEEKLEEVVVSVSGSIHLAPFEHRPRVVGGDRAGLVGL